MSEAELPVYPKITKIFNGKEYTKASTDFGADKKGLAWWHNLTRHTKTKRHYALKLSMRSIKRKDGRYDIYLRKL
jgi:hypothetical protein